MNLGLQQYADGSDASNVDLLKNLEGCTVHRFSPGTGEHAGTALMVVELQTGEGLGVQIEMDTQNDRIPVHPCTRGDGGEWQAEAPMEYRDHDTLEPDGESLEILEVAQSDLMNPEEARVLAILNPSNGAPYTVDIHLDDRGGTEFFEVAL